MQFLSRFGLASALALLLPGWAAAQSVDRHTSTVAVDRTTALANGVDLVTVTVRVLKGNQQPYPGKQVTLSLSGPGDAIVQPGLTDSNGECTGAVATTRAGLRTVRARVLNIGAERSVRSDDHEVLLDQRPTIEFTSNLRLRRLSPRFVRLDGVHTVTLKGQGFARPGAGSTSVLFGSRPATDVVVVDDATITCQPPAPDPTVGPVVDVTVSDALGAATLDGDFTYCDALRRESFESGVLPPWLEYADAPMVIADGVIRDAGDDTSVDRRYARTTTTDWVVRDFVFEATMNVGPTPPGSAPILFAGIGRGEPDPAFHREPLWAFGFRLHPAEIAGGRLEVAVYTENNFGPQIALGTQSGEGARRVRIVKQGASISFQLMLDWTSGPFVPDLGYATEDMFELAPFLGTDASRLYFGGSGTQSSFDDVVVAELPRLAGLASLEPHVGLEDGGTTVRLRGRGFLSGGPITVRFGDRLATAVSVIDDERLTCETPARDLLEPAFVDVTLVNDHGTSTLERGFCYATQVRREDFSGTTLPPWLEDATNAFAIEDGELRELNQAPDNQTRTYVRTRARHHDEEDFVYEMTMRTGRDYIGYAGLGTGEPDLTFFGRSKNSIFIELLAPNVVGGRIDWALQSVGDGGEGQIGESQTYGHRRVRLIKQGSRLALAHMDRWPGTGPFLTDAQHAVQDLAATAPFVTDGRLFFGGAAPTFRYDDVVIGTLRPAPVHVGSVFEATGPTGGGLQVTISGDGFLGLGGAPVVRFGSTPATAVVVLDDRTLTCVIPPHAAGLVAVSIRGALGSGIALDAFRYVPGDAPPPPPPEARLQAVTPAYGLEAGGTALTLRGSGFVAGATVTIDGRPATSVVVVDPSTITCVTPAADPLAPPYVDVVVMDGVGTTALSHAFGYATELKTESFSGSSLPAWLEAPPGYFVIEDGSIHDESPNDQTNRRYCRTVDGGYWGRDFAYELSIVVGPDYIVYPGIGTGEPDFSFFSEPLDALTFRLHSPNVSPEGGRIDVASYVAGGFFEFHTIGASQAYDVRRVRVLKQGQRATFAHMGGWSPVRSFVAQHSHTFEDVAVSAPYKTATNGHLMFGGGAPSFRFDDLLVATLRTSPVRVAQTLGDTFPGSTLTVLGSGFSTLGGSPQVRIGLLAASVVTVVTTAS